MSETFAEQLNLLPPGLRGLVEAEIAAGNSIAAVEVGFPAPPVGFCLRLERPVSTRTEGADDGVLSRDWPNWKREHGYTDERGLYFVLDPLPPPPDESSPRGGLGSIDAAPPTPATEEERHPASRSAAPSAAPIAAPRTPFGSSDLVGRFRASLEIDYEKWHEGIGYDVELLNSMGEDELAAVESLLIARGINDWRDVEALSAIDTPSARQVLRDAMQSDNGEIRLAVSRLAPKLVSPAQGVASLVDALATVTPYHGLSEALDLAADCHPPEVIDALWRGVNDREGAVAVHYAALLYYLSGPAKLPFDWDFRPFFLTFRTDDPAERQAAVAELGRRLGRRPNSTPE